jgi:hypothetical protein
MDEIVTGRRRMRTGRRRSGSGRGGWIVLILILLVGAGGGAWYWLHRTTPQAGIPDPAVVASGSFNSTINDAHTITIGMGIRNTANVPVTVMSARIVAPAGLVSTIITLAPVGSLNQAFALDGELPALQPVQLGTDNNSREAIVAARFTVQCSEVVVTPTPAVPTEQIFVTVQVAGTEREEELTPPLVDGIPWLAGTAQKLCVSGVPAASPSNDQPLPSLPNVSAS